MPIRATDTSTEASAGRAKPLLRARKDKVDDHKHPVNVVHHDEATFGERLADRIAAGIGSWSFLIIQTFAVTMWVTINIIGLVKRWDPFPFILLNLLFSVQAAYTGPVLLLAGNRQSQKDRLTLEHAAAEAEKADDQNVQILKAIEKNTEMTLRILKQCEQLVENVAQAETAKKTA